MGVTYEDALKAQAEIEDNILTDPNVVSVGVVAETNSQGKSTGDYAIQVGVLDEELYHRNSQHGLSAIPHEYKLKGPIGKNQQKHVHIHVVQEGKIEALFHREYRLDNDEDIPSAIDRLHDDSLSSNDHTSRRRPSPCGLSISHENVSAGTIGCLVEYSEGPDAKKSVYLVSNNHVIVANNLAKVGDDIIQPGRYDSGVPGPIAFLHRWVPLNTTGYNYVDAEITEVKGKSNSHEFIMPDVMYLGIPNMISEATIGMSVEKVGRTTGHTFGKIVSSRFSTKIEYPMSLLTFRNQIRTTNMSRDGDSGSCLFEQNTPNIVGLLFAGSATASYFNPISVVLAALSDRHTNSYPSGKVKEFKKDFPLRLFQKRKYSTSFYDFKHNSQNPSNRDQFPYVYQKIKRSNVEFFARPKVFTRGALYKHTTRLLRFIK